MEVFIFFIGLSFIYAALYLASWPRAPRSARRWWS